MQQNAREDNVARYTCRQGHAASRSGPVCVPGCYWGSPYACFCRAASGAPARPWGRVGRERDGAERGTRSGDRANFAEEGRGRRVRGPGESDEGETRDRRKISVRRKDEEEEKRDGEKRDREGGREDTDGATRGLVGGTEGDGGGMEGWKGAKGDENTGGRGKE